MVVTPNQNYFRLINKILKDVPQLELLWAAEKIRGLSDLFMNRPKGLIIMFETNHESLDFLKLVRNNPSFEQLPVVMIFTEPLQFKQKMTKRLNITCKLGTPIPHQELQNQIKKMITEA